MHELVRRMITAHDRGRARRDASRRIAAAGVASVDDVRRAGQTLVGFSPELRGAESAR